MQLEAEVLVPWRITLGRPDEDRDNSPCGSAGGTLSAPSSLPMTGLERDNVASLGEAAELLHMPRSTVSELARRGKLPARKIGRRWVFLRDLLHAAVLPDGHPDAWRPRHDEQPPRNTSS